MPEVNAKEEHVGGYRLRNEGDALVVDERARRLLFEFLRVFFGVAFMAPACVLLGAATLPGGLSGIRPNPEANEVPVTNWLLAAPFLCIPVLFFLIGFNHAFARKRIVAQTGSLLVGNTWFGYFQRLKAYPLGSESALEYASPRGGAFCGLSFPLLLTTAGKEQAELLCHSGGNGIHHLAEAIAAKSGITSIRPRKNPQPQT